MKKIPSLFKRNWHRDRQAYNEITPGTEWVITEGVATIKWDGTACMIKDGVLYKRYDRKTSRKAIKRGPPFTEKDCKTSPKGWIPCQEAPDQVSGHWPGWLVVGDGPEDKWHREANIQGLEDGTYELVGPKVQGNPYEIFGKHMLIKHGYDVLENVPVSFNKLIKYLARIDYEGIVWHHPDGRMAKAKRTDFGFEWPIKDKE